MPLRGAHAATPAARPRLTRKGNRMIEVTGLTKRYGSHTVLDNVDFTVESGSIAAVVGPSGAGKSTLFRCVNLLERPTAGTVCVDGQELTHLSSRELRGARRAIGTVFQSANLLRRPISRVSKNP